MDTRTLERKTVIMEGLNGPIVAFALHGEIGVLSCEVTLANGGLMRVGANAPYKGEMKINAHVSTHRHYPRNPLEKWHETKCRYLDGHCYGTSWADTELAYRFVTSDISGLWRRMEMIYERWWRSVKNDSETEDHIYLEVE